MTKHITFYFHASVQARTRYSMEHTLFALRGNIVIGSFAAARQLSQRINDIRGAEGQHSGIVTPGLVYSLGLMHEILHLVLRHYEEKENPGVFERWLSHTANGLGDAELDTVLIGFIHEFPPQPVYQGKMTAKEYLTGSTGEKRNREILIEELLLLHLENLNPAFAGLKELFDETPLAERTAYKEVLQQAEKFFDEEKPLSFENLTLLKALKKPILENPHDVEAQLGYMSRQWRAILPEAVIDRMLGSSDLLKEDARLFNLPGGGGSKPTPQVPVYKLMSQAEIDAILGGDKTVRKMLSIDDISLTYLQAEEEQFTEDLDWMPRVVMIAKNTYVWMDQLSKKYGRQITRLDEIPDEELDQLAQWNFTALWLIGLWERSPASKKIKQFCGNPDAAPSAYSLYDYVIADTLGGEGAFQNLRHRCWIRGIRLSSDMVPNHTGIFSKWVMEHPEYFIQADYPPYPNYSFTGPDLSDDPSYQVRIEDRYYSKQDAAVVFQRVDNGTGKAVYIYHGNDGTNMPWNDTAQLNLLRADVRESLVQTIMHVARKTPIIRFDAAMTLAKKHFQRLWFPVPGTGGAIPSRADYAMSRADFDAALPVEFWREVVDRMNAEMPNTLLLAEAFWLMEGYFVRTLGMHRVYNSAFMHMFMKEENKKYRELIRNTLEFNPEILKRYVNFMSNPDEETAVNQFGKGDKYTGVAVMLVTMPGLPMFAHGQVEGYTEKYGMEYYRAYYQEQSDPYLIARHEREIFPLMQKRYLFSQVENFELFDFTDEHGEVNENVFAFTNMHGGERALVLYNNSYEQAAGRLTLSTGKAAGAVTEDEPGKLRYLRLHEALRLNTGWNIYYLFREHHSGLEFIRSAAELVTDGFRIHIQGYQYAVFHSFRETEDTLGNYHKIHQHLNGRGVGSVDEAIREFNLAPLHAAVEGLFTRDTLDECLSAAGLSGLPYQGVQLSLRFEEAYSRVIDETASARGIALPAADIIGEFYSDLMALGTMHRQSTGPVAGMNLRQAVIIYDEQKQQVYRELVIIYLTIRRLLMHVRRAEGITGPEILYDELLLSKPIWQNLIRLNDNYSIIKQEFDLLKLLATSDTLFAGGLKSRSSINFIALLRLPQVLSFIGYNSYNGVVYFSKENFTLLLRWIFTLELIKETQALSGADSTVDARAESPVQMLKLFEDYNTLASELGYRFNELMDALRPEANPVPEEPVSKPALAITKAAASKKSTKKTTANTAGKRTKKGLNEKGTDAGGTAFAHGKEKKGKDRKEKEKKEKKGNKEKKGKKKDSALLSDSSKEGKKKVKKDKKEKKKKK